ncbi:MAG TPA: hypothetical protein PLO62_09285 [Candidatus Hydrogenedentes bacterium]|nr:hypothetical protein [Candidatus Hydrogenedentota bacterium]HOS02686.1 hypothetical protein [Candidatus Hydrogenedentota bacterium]
MPFEQLDRMKLNIKPLSERKDKVYIEKEFIAPETPAPEFSDMAKDVLDETIARIKAARDAGKPRMLTFGAHSVKNCLSPVFIKLIESGWITHLATNGAGIIHDWEFAFQGHSSEDVRANVTQGQFGVWQETGFNINLAIVVGAYEGLGYGESVGAFVEKEGLMIPSEDELRGVINDALATDPERAAAAADLIAIMRRFDLKPGWMAVPHPFKQFGLQSAAYRLGVPFTGHPMIGHDIIYVHPMNHCPAIGRAAQRDFLAFAQNVSNLEGGVYMSIGSAVMSPMIFEKSLSMSQNLWIQQGKHIDNHYMLIVDLAKSHWDWTKGEPPMDNPDYYLRYNKTFARMGGTMRYLSADNRDFLLALLHGLEGK